MHEQLKRDAVKGIGWAFFSSVSVRIFQVATTVTLAKLLVPADFGAFSLTTIIIAAMALISDIGFAQVLIYRQGDIRNSANTAFILATVTSTILAALICVFAPFVANAFGAPVITLPLRLMSAGLIVSGATSVPLALLDKEMKFRQRAIPEVISAFTYAVVSISLAALHFGVWSMVIGWTAMSIVGAITTWLVSTWRPAWEFHREGLRVILNYGGHLVIATFASFLFLQIDNAAVGKWLGLTALGFYSIAFTTCNMPATNMTSVINKVMFPTYSKLNGDMSEFRNVYLQTMKHLSSLAFPAAAALMTLPDPIIRVLYGKKWEGAIPLFHVLALYGLMRAIGATSSVVFMAMGRPQLVRRVSWTQLLIGGSLAYPVAKHFGVMGIAILFTIAYLIGTSYGLIKVKSLMQISASQWLGTVKSSAISAVVAGALAWIAILWSGHPNWFTIGLDSLVLVSAYAVSMLLTDRSVFVNIKSTIWKRAKSEI